jgi:hypothetical protein
VCPLPLEVASDGNAVGVELGVAAQFNVAVDANAGLQHATPAIGYLEVLDISLAETVVLADVHRVLLGQGIGSGGKHWCVGKGELA